ncbi:MAG: hypothetical protein RLZZ449_1397 [Actinomycetota bacterium]
MRRDLVGAPVLLSRDGPESLPWGPDRIRPARDDRLDLVRSRVGGEIEIELRRCTIDQEIANAAADQEQFLSLRTKQFAEWCHFRQHWRKPLRNHDK